METASLSYQAAPNIHKHGAKACSDSSEIPNFEKVIAYICNIKVDDMRM